MSNLDEISMMLGEIRANMINLTKQQEQHARAMEAAIDEVKSNVESVNNDVSDLKTFKVQVVSYCTAASACVTFIISAIAKWWTANHS